MPPVGYKSTGGKHFFTLLGEYPSGVFQLADATFGERFSDFRKTAPVSAEQNSNSENSAPRLLEEILSSSCSFREMSYTMPYISYAEDCAQKNKTIRVQVCNSPIEDISTKHHDLAVSAPKIPPSPGTKQGQNLDFGEIAPGGRERNSAFQEIALSAPEWSLTSRDSCILSRKYVQQNRQIQGASLCNSPKSQKSA